MADSMYDEESSPVEDDAAAPKDDKSDETEDQLALVPKHFFKGEPKPGMREMVEVVQVYEGEVSIKCVYGEDKDEEEQSEGEELESEPQDEMMT
jgi:hypothetical protein